MEENEKFFFAIIAFIFGILIAKFFNLQLEEFFFIKLFFLLTLCIGCIYKPFRIYTLFFILGVCVLCFRIQNLSSKVVQKNESVAIIGTIERVYFKGGGIRALLKVKECNSKPCGFKKLIASFKQEERIALNSQLKLEGRLIPLPKKVYPSFYDVEEKQKFNKVAGYLSVRSFEIIKEGGGVVDAIRNHVLENLERLTDVDAKSIAIALFLGDKGKISKEEYESFRRAGLAHVLAISGLHMSIACILVFTVFWRFFSFFRLDEKIDVKIPASLLGLCFGFLYLLIAGVPVSGMRSFLMVFFAFAGFVFGRGIGGMRSLFLAAFVILFFWPEEVFYPSFQLSFMAVLCLLSLPEFHFRYRSLEVLLQVVISSFLVSVLTLPFAVHHFGFVHLYGSFSNIIAIPFLSMVIMPFGIFGVITGFAPFLWVFEWSIIILSSFAKFFASLPFSAIFLPFLSGFVLMIFGLSLSLLMCFKNTRVKMFGKIFLCISIALYIKTTRMPNFVINEEYAVIKSNNKYISLFYIPNGFLKEIWEQKLNAKLIPFKEVADLDFKCQDGVCFRFSKVPFTLIFAEDFQMPEGCTGGLFVNMVSDFINSECFFLEIKTNKDFVENSVTPFIL